MHQPLPALRGDHTQVWLAAVGGELRAVRGRWWRLGRDDLAQAAAIGHGKETWRGSGTHVAISCRNTGDREGGGEGMATVGCMAVVNALGDGDEYTAMVNAQL